MKWHAIIGMIIAVLVHAHAYAGTIDDCIANFTDQIELLKTSSDIINAVENSESAAIRGLGIYLRQGTKFAEDGVARKHKANFEWELGQILVDARELIKFQRQAASESDLQQFADSYQQQILEKMDAYQHQPAVTVIQNGPNVAGAEYYPAEGISQPVVPVFVAGSKERFENEIRKLSTASIQSIKRRLHMIAESGVTSNATLLTKANNKTAVPLYEMKFFSGVQLRLLFLKTNKSVVLLHVFEKSTNAAQDNEIKKPQPLPKPSWLSSQNKKLNEILRI